MSVVNRIYTKKFTWRIENFRCIKNKCLQSPTFESNAIKWELSIFSADSEGCINLKLQKLNSKQRFSLNYSIAFLDSEYSILLWKERKNIEFGSTVAQVYNFGNNTNLKTEKNIDTIFIKSDEVFGSKKFKFFSCATLIVECRMWFGENIFLLRPEEETFFACSRFQSTPIRKKKKFVLNVNDVSSLAPNFNLEYVEPMEGTESSERLLMIQLSLNSEEVFFVKVTSSLYRMQANFKVSLLDVTGKRIQFADVQSDFKEKHQMVMFNTNITKLMLMSYRNQFLINEMLSLVFEYTLLCEISFSRLVSETEYFAINTEPIVLPLTPGKRPRPVTPEIEPTNNSNSPNNVYQALESVYKEGFLSDFSLRAQEKTFPVHKVILGSRSSVFRAMFTADMKEKESSCVDIPDVDADTLQKMLKFIYYDSIQEDMDWEGASSLYAAADKYALDPLKQKCSDILKSGLSTSSIFGVLMIADSHHDEDLKDTALDFILENDKEIMGTDLWCKFAEQHSKLAFEAIQKLYIKKMDLQ